jgi:hypothetical protein
MPTWDNRPSTTSNAAVAPSPLEKVSGVVREIESAAQQTAESPAGGAADISANEAASEADTTAEPANGAAIPVGASGIAEEHVAEIRGIIQAQQKFLGELLEHAHRWELEGAELRIYFATEKRAFAEMVEGRDSLEKIRATSSKVLNRSVRVCAKMESVAATAANASQTASGTKELREKFERDPMVRAMLQRFGGKISEVKRREERP